MATTSSEMSFTCPCCGGKMLDRPDLDLNISGVESTLADLLTKSYPRALTLNNLMDQVYSDRQDGRPKYATTAIKVSIHRLRSKLAPAGWTIAHNVGGRGMVGKYALKPLIQVT